MNIRVHRILQVTEAEGPGKRLCIWVQGCQRHCRGCFNKETWDINAGIEYSISQLIDQVLDAADIEGVTFVGGEPFLQAETLAQLGRQYQNIGLSIVTFTGYTYEEILRADRPDWNALLEVTDLLLSGPYREEHQDFSRPWVGSTNQEFIFLTSRYKHLENSLKNISNQLELSITADGLLFLNGLASELLINDVRQQLATLGLTTHT